MASIGHVAVGMAVARAYDPARKPRWHSMALWSALALLPDIDVIGFLRGLPYGAPWGHRGATHSLTFAFAGAAVVALGARWRGRPFVRTFGFASIVLASHGLLDAMTDGGLGAALFWPFTLTRYFAPWRPITVAPIGPDFFTPYGALVAASEVVLFAPLLLYALWPRRRALRPAAIAAVALVWLGAGWLIASTDPVRERVLAAALRDDTRFASGYSEDVFRTIAVGDDERAVRGSLGEPLNESWFFPPKDRPFQSAMEVSAAQLPRACLGVWFRGAAVEEVIDRQMCEVRGVVPGLARAEVIHVLGAPVESCAAYAEGSGPGFHRMRMVCFLRGKVEVVIRRWL